MILIIFLYCNGLRWCHIVNVILTGLIYEMTSKGDTNTEAQINAPSHTPWRAERSGAREYSETCSSSCVTFLGRCTSWSYDKPVNDILWNIIRPVIYSPSPIEIEVRPTFLCGPISSSISCPRIWNVFRIHERACECQLHFFCGNCGDCRCLVVGGTWRWGCVG